MEKLKYLLFLLLIIPFNVNAINFNVKDKIIEEKEINESSIILGNEVDIKANVEKLNIALGNSIQISGNSEYLLTVGNVINISSEIKKDSVILGNSIKINNSKINDDIFILGNEVEVDANVLGNVKIFANSVTLKGECNNANIKAKNIIIDGNVKNKLLYNEDAKINIKDENKIGSIEKTEKITKENNFNENIMMFINNYGGILVLFLALYFIFPKLFKNIGEKNNDFNILNIFSLFGFGSLSMILIPIIIILLFTLIFGLPLSILLLLFYIMAMIISIVLAEYLIGSYILKMFNKNNNPLLNGLVGITLISLLCLIPGIGSLIQLSVIMIGMGLVLQQLKRD